MQYRYILDGNLIDDPTGLINPEPAGWEKFTTVINRDTINKGIVVTQNFNLTFGKTYYNYFYNKVYNQDYCNYSEILIEYSIDDGNSWLEFHYGIIYLVDIEFDEKRKECTVKIQDNSFYAWIKQNINIKTKLIQGSSKNLISIPVTPANFLDMGGSNNFGKCYTVFDIFKYLVAFMTDNKVLFKSTLFDIGGEYSGFVLTTGYQLQSAFFNSVTAQEFGDNFPEISFKDFFTEMNKIFNITWWIERVGSINYIRIEKEEDARSLNKIDLTIKNIDELESKINEEILYGSVSVGGREYQDFPYLSLRNDQLTYVGFKNETFQVKGQCNLDKVLDLKSSYIFDHNIIENCLINGSSTSFEFDFIKDIFVISCKLISGTYVAEMTSWVYGSLSNTTNLYNEQLTNIKIILRWNNILNQSYIGIGGTTTNGAKVYAFSADVNIIGRWGNGGNDTVRVQFEYDTIYGFDLSNNYGNGTSTPVSQPNSIYTAPIQDFYRHIVIFEWIILGKNSLQSQAAPITVKLRIFDSTSFNYNTITINRTYTGYPDYHWIANDIFDFGFVNMNPGDYAQIDAGWGASIYINDERSFYPAPQYGLIWNIIPNKDGVVANVDYNDIPIIENKFTIPLTFAEYLSIKNNPISQITFNRYNEQKKSGWIKSMNYDHDSQLAKFTIISTKNSLAN